MTSQQTARDVVDELTTDHRDALATLDQMTQGGDPALRREMADVVIAELVRHSVAEEMYVYPAMRKHLENGERLTEHDTEEHKKLEKIMKRLEGMDASDAEFDGLVRELRSALAHHAQDEESEQFPLLRQHLPAETLVELREKVETAKKIAPTRPHPGAPNSELFHKLLGPGVGLVDRARDKLTNRAN